MKIVYIVSTKFCKKYSVKIHNKNIGNNFLEKKKLKFSSQLMFRLTKTLAVKKAARDSKKKAEHVIVKLASTVNPHQSHLLWTRPRQAPAVLMKHYDPLANQEVWFVEIAKERSVPQSDNAQTGHILQGHKFVTNRRAY